MKKITTLLLLSVLSPLALFAYPGSLWQKVEGNVASKGTQQILPEKYDTYALNRPYIKSFLSSLPKEAESAQELDLPSPDGGLRTFKIWKSQMMEPALSTKYPEIQTFTGVAADDPRVTIKLDYTITGFHAMVFDGRNTYFIDPYSSEDDGYYVCYYKKDYLRPMSNAMACEVEDEHSELGGVPMHLNENGLPNIKFKVNGTLKRTYRLALACTGEYANAVTTGTPTKAAVLSKMVTSMNRVNGVYEKELAVTMVLIANTDTLIFLDGTTDPYSNTSGDLGANQTTITARIGSANYDIGHLFGTGGGGIAMKGSVCKSNKARGLTGSPNPVGDPFDIDYVAHEIGHQFGADHTFNASSGSCSGNGEPSEAYEPGSATTIMGYAGICGGGNDIQQNSDDYFHAKSLDLMSNFITSSSGANCAVTTPSANVPPVVPAFTQSYTIPYLTPFEITAPAAVDADHDNLSYCWEQYNRGDFGQSWNNVKLRGPIFRSFEPDTSRTRVFPEMSKVLAGVTSYLGEKLPEVTRYLTFKLTVRDVLNGIGTFNIPDDTIHLDVTSTAGPFKVFTPATAVTWVGGSNETITWDVAGTDQSPVNCSHVDIYVSTDGGLTFPHLVLANTPNDGSETIKLPNVETTQARVKIKGSNNVFFNVNAANFNITFNTSVKELAWQSAIRIYPVPADDVLHVTNDYKRSLNIQVVNAVGQRVYSGEVQKHVAIPVSTWARGMYYMQLTEETTGEKIIRPLMIQ